MAAMLGDDGRGFELARRLESCGVWRAWLGEAAYSSFAQFLASPAHWESFLAADGSQSRSQLQLQLRARALLFDKASVLLYLGSASSSAHTPAGLNPAYLQLHGDDVYYPLEEEPQSDVELEVGSNPPYLAHYKGQSRVPHGPVGSNIGSKAKVEVAKSWYSQRSMDYRGRRQHKFQCGEGELMKRTSEGMANYLTLLSRLKKRRFPFKEEHGSGITGSGWNGNSHSQMAGPAVDEGWFIPEVLFPFNCVPENAVGSINRDKDFTKTEVRGILDTLPSSSSRSTAMYERFGIKPDDLRVGSGTNKYLGNLPGVKRRCLSEEQAHDVSKKLVALILSNVGAEGATEASLEVLSQFLSCHICKLGRTLKVLSDNYRKQYSAVELIKMFLQTIGYGNLGTLTEYVKYGTKAISHSQNKVQESPQRSNSLIQAQQMPRQMHPHLQMQLHPQNLTYQQQQMLRKHQQSPQSPVLMTSEKDRSMVEVKMESPMELPMDSATIASVSRQLQFRQMASVNHQPPFASQMSASNHQSHSGHHMAMASNYSQGGHQLKSLPSAQVSHMQSQGMSGTRSQPVKVEGFQELMGGEAKPKHDSEEQKLTSPPK